MNIRIFQAFRAPLSGLKLVTSDRELRRLAFRPWTIGLLVYVVIIPILVISFPPVYRLVLSRFPAECGPLCEAIVSFGLIASFLFASIVLTVSISLIIGGYYQLEIAKRVLEIVPESSNSGVGELLRSIFVELIKFAIAMPLIVIALLLGIVPIFIPVAFLLSSWVLGWQYLDLSLDARSEGVLRRILFPLRHPIATSAFGAPLALASIVPFLLVFLAPAAAAGGALLIKRSNMPSH